jgi:rhomboid family GlyGly-CTERM serine protease
VAKPQQTRLNFPLITMSGVCFCLIAYAFPAVSDLIVYDRQLVLQGQVWRLVTGVFVHFSMSHLVWNLLVFCLSAWVVETSGKSKFPLLCILGALIPGVWFAAGIPQMARYGGISGLATAMVVYLCLGRLRRSATERPLWFLILLLVMAKSVMETITGTPLFVKIDGPAFYAMPWAHAIGGAVALAVYGWEVKGGKWNPS